MRNYFYLSLLVFLFTSLRSQAQDGALDTGFGTAGAVTLQFGFSSAEARAIAIQPDGKVIIAGNVSGNNGNIGVARYDANGVIDPFFAFGGFASHPMTAATLILSARVLSDGKILLAGQRGNEALLARLTAAGLMDASFGTNGVVTFGGTGSITKIVDFTVLSDGKIVGGGPGQLATQPKYCVFRRNANGTADNSFGTSGITAVDPGNANATADAFSFEMRPDGRMILGGTVYSGSSTDFDLLMYGFTANGQVDNTFGTNGKSLTNFQGNSKDQVVDMALQADGKIVVVGRVATTTNRMLLARFNANGALDMTFGTTGSVLITPPSPYSSASGKSVTLLTNGKIIALGSVVNTSTGAEAIFLQRYNANGTLDNTFGTGGSTVHLQGTRSLAERVRVAANGKIYVAGYALINNTFMFMISRFNNSGTSSSKDVFQNALQVSTYPNPCIETISFDWTADLSKNAARIVVTDVNQRPVFVKNLSFVQEGTSETLEVASLPAGYYLLHIQDETARPVAVGRFLKN